MMSNKKQEAQAKYVAAQAKYMAAQKAFAEAERECEVAAAELAALPQPTAEEEAAAMATIQRELDNAGAGNAFDAEELEKAFEVFGVDVDIDEDLKVLAAALEYFGGDVAQSVEDFAAKLSKALEIVDGGNFEFVAEAYDEESLGEILLVEKLDEERLSAEKIELVLAYFDCEEYGKFTNAGYFALKE